MYEIGKKNYLSKKNDNLNEKINKDGVKSGSINLPIQSFDEDGNEMIQLRGGQAKKKQLFFETIKLK